MALKLIEAKVDFGSVFSTKSLLFMYLSVNQLTYFICVKKCFISNTEGLAVTDRLLEIVPRICSRIIETDFLD